MFQCWPVLVVAVGVTALVYWYDVLPKDDPDYDLQEVVLQSTNSSESAGVFITVEELHELMVNSPKGVTVLDARNKYNPIVARSKPGAGKSIPGSHRASWGMFTVSGSRGDLKPIPDVEAIFRDLSVYNDVPVVVYGSWKEEWGEEGRIYWQLDYLGHKNVSILYGGIFSWDESGLDGKGIGGKGDFVASPNPEKISSADEIADLIDAGGDDLFLLDARTKTEFDGSTQYNVARGGHIPGAVSFHWKEVFAGDGSGNLKDPDVLRARLDELGLRDGMKIAAYCTGGVRSGFFYAVFKWLGYSNVSNYPGSWWDWASRTELPISTFAGHS